MNHATASDADRPADHHDAGIYPRLITLGGVILPIAGLIVGLWL